MTLTIEIEQEDDGRWIAEIPQIPGTMTYGRTREEAVFRVEALALRVRFLLLDSPPDRCF
jgi:predicted RNase H-like HicB family nuclease